MSRSPETPAPKERPRDFDRLRRQIKSRSRLSWFVQQRLLKPHLLLKGIWEWILFRTVYRYHVIKLGIPPGHYDADHRMLYACFKLLVDYVELEKPDRWWGWTDEEPIWMEIKTLYYWWKDKRPIRRAPIEDVDEDGPPIADVTGVCMSYEDALRKSADLQIEWDNEDNEMLARLIKIRGHLWT